MTDLFDVLADGTRRSILEHLRREGAREEGLKVGELVAALEVSQPTVSKHLKVLREAGLVSVREEGQSRRYRLESSGLADMGTWLAPFVEGDVDGDAARASADAASTTAYSAWAGVEVGDRVGRAAAETAHRAQLALEAAQDKIQGARQTVERSVRERLPVRGRD